MLKTYYNYYGFFEDLVQELKKDEKVLSVIQDYKNPGADEIDYFSLDVNRSGCVEKKYYVKPCFDLNYLQHTLVEMSKNNILPSHRCYLIEETQDDSKCLTVEDYITEDEIESFRMLQKDICNIPAPTTTPETVKPSPSVKAVERPLKEEFEDVIKRIGKNNFLEICSYVKYHGLSTEKICAKYDVTSWFINNVRQVFNFACDSRNDNIIKDFNNGYSKEQLMQKYNLKSSRIGNILKHYRLIYTLSKELF